MNVMQHITGIWFTDQNIILHFNRSNYQWRKHVEMIKLIIMRCRLFWDHVFENYCALQTGNKTQRLTITVLRSLYFVDFVSWNVFFAQIKIIRTYIKKICLYLILKSKIFYSWIFLVGFILVIKSFIYSNDAH